MSETESQVTDEVTYVQEILDALSSKPAEGDSGNTPAEDAGKEGTEEAAKASEDERGEDANVQREEEGEGKEEVTEEAKPAEDKLDHVEKALQMQKEAVRLKLEMQEKYKDATTWRAKADEFDALASDPLRYLEEKAPQLLERWVEMRYGKSPLGADKKPVTEQKPVEDKRYAELQKQFEELKQRDVERHYQTVIDGYKSEIASEVATQKESLAKVDKYCKAHGYDFVSECVEHARNLAKLGKSDDLSAQTVVKQMRDFVLNEIKIAKELDDESPAKPVAQSEERTRKTKTLGGNLKGSAPRSEEIPVTDLDSYKADLLRDLKKGGRG